jgi:hypothetical protein
MFSLMSVFNLIFREIRRVLARRTRVRLNSDGAFFLNIKYEAYEC